MKKSLLLTCIICTLSLSAHAHNHSANEPTITTQAAITNAVNAPSRTPENRLRDQYRNPAKTLSFFGVEPHQTVVEIWPGAGWYTEILAPLLNEKGQYYAAGFPMDTDIEYFNVHGKKLIDKLAATPAYSNAKITEFRDSKIYDVAPAGTADVVLTFRNLHNFYMQEDIDGLTNSFATFYKALKPGGILGVVDHELPESRDQKTSKHSGYLKKSLAVEYAQKAGFILVAESDINKNPKDTADHPNGVWSLPPVHKGADKALLEVGESDRFTLKFQKPIK